MYCILHGVYELGYTGNCILVSCPPPELPSDWIEHVQEPSEEELIEMDMSAECLADELGLEN